MPPEPVHPPAFTLTDPVYEITFTVNLVYSSPREELLSPLTDEAIERSKELLFSHLSDEQRDLFERVRYFYVRTKIGYFALTDTGINVYRTGWKGRAISVHQAVPTYDGSFWNLPSYDRILGQTLLLEADPNKFLDIACRYGVYPTEATYLNQQWPGLILGEFFPGKGEK